MRSAYLPSDNVRAELVEFQSGDQRVQGAMFHPANASAAPNTAVLIVHGVESFWYKGPPMFLAAGLADLGLTTLGYNGVHNGLTFRWSTFEGAVAEVQDAIDYLKGRGFTRVILLGHSLGTAIVERHAGACPDGAVVGVGVLGPHISIPEVTRDSLLGVELYHRYRADCLAAVESGRGADIKLLPYRPPATIITSAATFLSYRDTDSSLATVRPILKDIRAPLLIVYDAADNISGLGVTTQRKTIADEIERLATSSASVRMSVVPSVDGNSPVQAHSFLHNESVVTRLTKNWIDTLA